MLCAETVSQPFVQKNYFVVELKKVNSFLLFRMKVTPKDAMSHLVLLIFTALAKSTSSQKYLKTKVSVNSFYDEHVIKASRPEMCANHIVRNERDVTLYSGFFYDREQQTCSLTNFADFENDMDSDFDPRETYVAAKPPFGNHIFIMAVSAKLKYRRWAKIGLI